MEGEGWLSGLPTMTYRTLLSREGKAGPTPALSQGPEAFRNWPEEGVRTQAP